MKTERWSVYKGQRTSILPLSLLDFGTSWPVDLLQNQPGAGLLSLEHWSSWKKSVGEVLDHWIYSEKLLRGSRWPSVDHRSARDSCCWKRLTCEERSPPNKIFFPKTTKTTFNYFNLSNLRQFFFFFLISFFNWKWIMNIHLFKYGFSFRPTQQVVPY